MTGPPDAAPSRLPTDRLATVVAVVLLLALVGTGCGGGKAKEAKGDIVWEPVDAPVVADGSGALAPTVNPRALPADDLRRVSDVVPPPKSPGSGLLVARGDGDPFTDATVVVRRMPEADREVVEANAEDDRVVTVAGDRQAVLLDAGDLHGTCGRGLALKASSGGMIEVLTVRGSRDDVIDIAPVAGLDEAGLPTVERLPAGWRTVEQLPPGWTDREAATQQRYRLLGGSTVTAVPTTDAEQRVLAAQLCTAPRSVFPPSGAVEDADEEWVGNLGSQKLRRWFVRGRVIYLGLLDAHTQVVLVPGRPGITVLTDFEGTPELSDRDLAAYVHKLELLDDEAFDRRAAEVTASQIRAAGEVARLALADRGHEVLELEERDGLAWRFSRGPADREGGDRPLCLTVVRRPDGRALLGNVRHPVPEPVCASPSEAVPPGAALTVPDPSDQMSTGAVWGFAGPDVARVAWADAPQDEAVPVAPPSGDPDGVPVFVLPTRPAPDGVDRVTTTLVAMDARGRVIDRVDLPTA